MKDPRVVAFRMPFWRWYLIANVAAQVLYAAVVAAPVLLGKRSPFGAMYLGGSAAISALMVPGILGYVLFWRVWVGPDVLRGSDFWGRFVTVTWPSIHAARPVNLPFLPIVRVYSTQTRRVIWLPLFLVDYARFAELVAEYAGEDHPVTREVWRRIETDT